MNGQRVSVESIAASGFYYLNLIMNAIACTFIIYEFMREFVFALLSDFYFFVVVGGFVFDLFNNTYV